MTETTELSGSHGKLLLGVLTGWAGVKKKACGLRQVEDADTEGVS